MICVTHSPLIFWLVWHDCVKFCWYILSLILIAHSYLSIRGRMMSCSSIVNQLSLECRTLKWPVWPLHMHRRIIILHTLVTEIKTMLTHNNIRTSITFHEDMSSIIVICSSSPQTKNKQLQFVYRNPIAVWWLSVKAICRCKRSWV